MKALNGPCPRDTVSVSGCSALERLVIDYGVCGSAYERQKMIKENDFYPTSHSIVKLLANYSEWESLYV